MHAVAQMGQISTSTNKYANRFSAGDFVDYRLPSSGSAEWKLGVLVRFLNENLVEIQIGEGNEWRCVQVDVDEDHLRPAQSSVFEDDE